MDAWIPITVAAAFFQNLRFMLQKHLKDSRLSTAGATFTRFFYGAPLAAALVAVLLFGFGNRLPAANAEFAIFAGVGGLAQIVATMCVVALFGERNFAVGIGFKKTETIQTAVLSLVVLGEGLSSAGLLAVIVGLAGVLLMSDSRSPDASRLSPRDRIFNRATGFGLAAGFLFGVSAIGYRGATLALGDAGVLVRASVTLAAVTIFQAAAMAAYLRIREAGQITAVLLSWRLSGLVGVNSMLGSLCWFAAFAMQHAAYVKALGQIELVFTFAGSYFVFRERITRREVAGILLVVGSILILVLL